VTDATDAAAPPPSSVGPVPTSLAALLGQLHEQGLGQGVTRALWVEEPDEGVSRRALVQPRCRVGGSP